MSLNFKGLYPHDLMTWLGQGGILVFGFANPFVGCLGLFNLNGLDHYTISAETCQIELQTPTDFGSRDSEKAAALVAFTVSDPH